MEPEHLAVCTSGGDRAENAGIQGRTVGARGNDAFTAAIFSRKEVLKPCEWLQRGGNKSGTVYIRWLMEKKVLFPAGAAQQWEFWV